MGSPSELGNGGATSAVLIPSAHVTLNADHGELNLRLFSAGWALLRHSREPRFSFAVGEGRAAGKHSSWPGRAPQHHPWEWQPSPHTLKAKSGRPAQGKSRRVCIYRSHWLPAPSGQLPALFQTRDPPPPAPGALGTEIRETTRTITRVLFSAKPAEPREGRALHLIPGRSN